MSLTNNELNSSSSTQYLISEEVIHHEHSKGTEFLNDLFADIARYVVELIGTFFLMLIIGFNVISGSPFGPLAIGSGLMILVFFGGHISGAHYNPAVTLGAKLTFRDHIGWKASGLYILVQIVGAIGASFIYWGITEETFTFEPATGFNNTKVFIVEFIFTSLLVSVMINSTTTKSQSGNSFFGLAIGFSVLTAGFTIGPISGAVLNPAIATGAAIADAIHHGHWESFKYIWIYWVAPLCGGILAAMVFRITNALEYTQRKDEDDEYRILKKQRQNSEKSWQ